MEEGFFLVALQLCGSAIAPYPPRSLLGDASVSSQTSSRSHEDTSASAIADTRAFCVVTHDTSAVWAGRSVVTFRYIVC
jgi:hypothetical protein